MSARDARQRGGATVAVCVQSHAVTFAGKSGRMGKAGLPPFLRARRPHRVGESALRFSFVCHAERVGVD